MNSGAELSRRHMLKGSAGALAALACPSLSPAADDKAPGYPPARAVTRGPKHHFFGYYDKTPWDATGQYLLAMEIAFYDRQPEPGEELTIGMVDLHNDYRYIALGKTRAWCWQQGTMLQWLGSAPGREIIYNTVADGGYAAGILDVHTGEKRVLPVPVYAVSSDGRQAVSLDFDRVDRLRPGYGYGALPERHKDDPAPENAGIYWMNLNEPQSKLVISLAWAAGNRPDERFEQAEHWFNHLQFNPSGTRFIFLHRWRNPQRKSWWTRLYTANPDGSEIRLLSDVGMVSHFDWRDDRTILAWTKTEQEGMHFYLIDDRTGEHTVMGDGVLTVDGHCSWSPDRKWVLNDTYPDRETHLQTLMLYRPEDKRRIDIGEFLLPPKLQRQPYRCDLHPRWNRDGTQVCIDSAHGPTRQVYVIDVGHITKA